jgi:hypothetical protein
LVFKHEWCVPVVHCDLCHVSMKYSKKTIGVVMDAEAL